MSIRRKARSLSPDTQDFEGVDFGFAQLVREGRFISMQRTETPEEYEGRFAEMMNELSELETEREQLRADLLAIVTNVGPARLVSICSWNYLRINPDTYKEWEDDRSTAHIEYLALQALDSTQLGPTTNPRDAFMWSGQAMMIVRELFAVTSRIILLESVRQRHDHPEDDTERERFRAQLESLAVRGASYAKHLKRTVLGCLARYDAECKDLVGYTAAEGLRLISAIGRLLDERTSLVDSQLRVSVENLRRELRRARRGRSTQVAFPTRLLKGDFGRAERLLFTMAASEAYAQTEDILKITPSELGAETGLATATCDAFLNSMSSDPSAFNERFHRMPVGGHPLTEYPLLRHDDGVIVPVGSALIDVLRPRMEDGLRKDARVWQRYLHWRGLYLEKESTALIQEALPGSSSHVGITWKGLNAESEVDGLVGTDDVGLRLQCKSGRVSAPARRGAPGRMAKDVKENIVAAERQHATLEAALGRQSPEALGFNSDQSRILRAPLQLEIVVCLDDVTVWSTEAHELSGRSGFADGRAVPWVVSLTDLMVVVEMVSGASFIHYLIRRHRLEQDGRITTHDELDWLGNYLKEGLYFADYFEGDHPPHVFQLLSYTEDFDNWYWHEEGFRSVPTNKPAQKIGTALASLLRRLERNQPEHWILGSLALLEGGQESRDRWEEMLEHCHEKAETDGSSDVTQVFDTSLGITVLYEYSLSDSDATHLALRYIRAKSSELSRANWVALVVGSSRAMRVIIEENDAGDGIVRGCFLTLQETKSGHLSRHESRATALDGQPGRTSTLGAAPHSEDDMFGLTVRFDLKDEAAAQGFDRLVAETAPGIREQEPGTLLYAVHTVEDAPLARVFYEMYVDREAFEAHESQAHTKRFLSERDQYIAQTRVEFLTPTGGKNLPQ